MTEQELQKLCRVWQKRLRLQDWNVTAKFTRAYDMQGKEGECTWNLRLKCGVIRILDPHDYRPCDWPYDPEETLVHELLHLHFAPFNEDDGLKDVAQDQAIEAIAQALVELARKDDEHGKESEEASSGKRGEVQATGEKASGERGGESRGAFCLDREKKVW